MKFRRTKSGVTICPFFIWTSENIEGLGHIEEDVNLVFCNHPKNKDEHEGNCQEKLCPLMPPRKTVVVNRHYKSYTKYIGRGTKFGNDYSIGPDGTREDVIAKHKKDFYADPELEEAVWVELRGEILGCFCKPLACHGDTYVEYIEERERTENETF